MGMIQLLDTNIILYFLAGKLLKILPDKEYYTSVIVEMEILSYPLMNKNSEKKAKEFLSSLKIIELTEEIKEIAIKLRREFNIKLPDAIIIATAKSLNAELLTNDSRLTKAYPHIKQLSLKAD